MPKTVVIGDLHGQYEIVDRILALNMPTIFMGDYLDSFHRSSDDGLLTLLKVLMAVSSRDDVYGLLGNHEWSYMEPRMRCSGYDPHTQSGVNLLRDLIDNNLQSYLYHEGFLFSHAGVSQNLLDRLELSLDDYLEDGEFFQIGRARGGMSGCGGLYWCDWNREFEPVHGVRQVVGHTRGDNIRVKEGNYCVDVLEAPVLKVLAVEDGEAEEWYLDEL